MNIDSRPEPKLLVVTPTLGTSPYLPATMTSVGGITGARVHHVLSVPTDRVQSLAAAYPECTVVPDQGRAGAIYGAVNAGLAAAGDDWDWFTYINDDDLLTPGFSRMVAAHCRPENAATVAYGDIRNIDSTGRALGRMTIERSPAWMPALLQDGISPAGQQGMMYGKSVVRALVEYRLQWRLCADLDFWVRAHAAGFRFVNYPWTVGCFRIQPGQLSGDVHLTRRELAAVTAKSFSKPISAAVRLVARAKYRLANLPRYLERWRAVGRLSRSESMLESRPPSP